MTFDLGDTWGLASDVRDADDALANASTVTLTITLPDGTTTSPTVTNPPAVTGRYVYDYVPTVAGRHTARWLFTFAGGTTAAYTDVLDVRSGASGLFSLAEAKSHLDITTTTDDEELRTWIGATTRVVENKAGPCVPTTHTQRVTNGGTWWLRHYPVLSLTSVTAALTGGTAVSTAELAFDADTGRVDRLDGRCHSGGPWTVTYRAGRTVIPENVLAAAKIILKHLWETQRGGQSGFAMGPDDVMVPGFPWAVPKRAVELLEADMQIWGYA